MFICHCEDEHHTLTISSDGESTSMTAYPWDPCTAPTWNLCGPFHDADGDTVTDS